MSEAKKYIVLRNLTRTVPQFEVDAAVRPDSPLGRTKSLGRRASEIEMVAKGLIGAEPPEIRLEVATLTKSEAEDARRDGRTLGLAEPMPTALITPVAAAESEVDPKGTTWGIVEIGAQASKLTGEGVKVAVLDTGIDQKHAAFAGMAADAIKEADFTGEGNGDTNGHGTHCAGTIFGRDVGGTRIGVAPGIESASIGKVLRGNGSGDTNMLFKGLAWAIGQDVDVISMSIGFDFPGYVKRMIDDGWPADLATSQALVAYRDNLRVFDSIMQQIRALAPFNRGTVVVAASGNESRADEDPDHRIAVSLPAAADGVISVGAVVKNGGKLVVAPFSNTMPRVCAPGVEIRSARAGTQAELSIMSGTSMACPHAAGIAALWWESLARSTGNATAREVEIKLIANVRTDVFLDTVAALDRGDGLVAAPRT